MRASERRAEFLGESDDWSVGIVSFENISFANVEVREKRALLIFSTSFSTFSKS